MEIFDHNASAWAGDVDYNALLQNILTCIVESWPGIEKPAPDEGEDEVTTRLYGQMKGHQWARKSPFRITLQWQIVEPGGDVIVGIPDILVETHAPQWEQEFINIECKRLRRKDATTPCRSGNSEYIDGQGQGMTAFTSGRYPAPCSEAIMIGYILCACKEPVRKLVKAVDDNASLLRLDHSTTPGMRPSAILVNDPSVRETVHLPHVSTRLRRISHVFLFSDLCQGPPSSSKKAPVAKQKTPKKSGGK